MGHIHSVIDADPHFKIDKTTRAVTDQSKVKSVLMQGDHNSERYTFEIPRYVDGHDMSLCDRVEIHYVNTNSTTRAENRGIYIVDDLQTSSTQPEDIVLFSWLISSAVTQNHGPLSFLIRFTCTENGKVVYAWNTGINKDNAIQMSMYNSDTVAKEFPDIFAQIQDKLNGKLDMSGHTPNKYLGTDEFGNIVEKNSTGGDVNYIDVFGKPQINGVELAGNKTLKDIGVENLINTKVSSKLDKNQGSMNANKNLETDDSGNVILSAKPTIPTTLPNPQALTFTGAVTGNYDGSAPLNVNIQNSEYEWVLIADISVGDPALQQFQEVEITQDMDGLPLEETDLFIDVIKVVPAYAYFRISSKPMNIGESRIRNDEIGWQYIRISKFGNIWYMDCVGDVTAKYTINNIVTSAMAHYQSNNRVTKDKLDKINITEIYFIKCKIYSKRRKATI